MLPKLQDNIPAACRLRDDDFNAKSLGFNGYFFAKFAGSEKENFSCRFRCCGAEGGHDDSRVSVVENSKHNLTDVLTALNKFVGRLGLV